MRRNKHIRNWFIPMVLAVGLLASVRSAVAVSFPDTPWILPYDTIWESLDNHPSPLVHVSTIGLDSAGGEIRAIKISDNAATNEDEPVFLFTGIIHGREIVGLRSVLGLVERLVNDYDSDPQVRDIVDSFQVWVIPAINPWGYQAENGGKRKNFNGVDLNSNTGFRWQSCYNDYCGDPAGGGFRGSFADSEPETRALNSLILRLKPIYGMTFHAGSGDQRGKVLWTHQPYDKGPDNERGFFNGTAEQMGFYEDDIAVTGSSGYRHARWIAENVLKPAIIDNSRRARGIMCTADNLPFACSDTPKHDSFFSSVAPRRNRTSWATAATGMLDFGVETNGDLSMNGFYDSHEAFRDSYFYEQEPELLTYEDKIHYGNAVEYARNYTDGMFGLLDHAHCSVAPGSVPLTGPTVTGTVVDEFGSPLQAVIRFPDMDPEVISGFSHLHGDYIDLDDDGVVDQPDFCTGFRPEGAPACAGFTAQNPPSNPLYGTDFMPRTADLAGRFYRAIPNNGAQARSLYKVEVSFPGKTTAYLDAERPIDQQCALDLGQIVLSEPQVPVTDCSVAPDLLSPQSGSRLPGSEVRFDWQSNGCHFYVRAGSTPGGSDYHNQSMAAATSVTVADLPVDGGDFHFTLFYRNTNLGGPWLRRNYEFQLPVYNNCEIPPFIQSPAETSTLAAGSDVVDIVTNGCLVWAQSGAAPHATNYAASQFIAGDQQDFQISGYPSDESDIFVRLLYLEELDGLSHQSFYAFKAPQDRACTVAPSLTSHASGDALAAGSDNLSWTSNGCHYWVYAGDAPGRNQYLNRSLGGSSNVTVSGYPADGTDVHLTLLYRHPTNGGAWLRQAFVLPTQ